MANASMGLPADLEQYLVKHGVREPEILARLRDETALIPQHNMQIAPEQGALLALLVELTGAKRCLEIGTFTGYSSLIVALAMPPDGTIVCCDVSEEWTAVARRYWAEAGVADRVDLRLAPALETLDAAARGRRRGHVRLRVRRRPQGRTTPTTTSGSSGCSDRAGSRPTTTCCGAARVADDVDAGRGHARRSGA